MTYVKPNAPAVQGLGDVTYESKVDIRKLFDAIPADVGTDKPETNARSPSSRFR